MPNITAHLTAPQILNRPALIAAVLDHFRTRSASPLGALLPSEGTIESSLRELVRQGILIREFEPAGYGRRDVDSIVFGLAARARGIPLACYRRAIEVVGTLDADSAHVYFTSCLFLQWRPGRIAREGRWELQEPPIAARFAAEDLDRLIKRGGVIAFVDGRELLGTSEKEIQK